jgi:hypothetical protein
MLVITLSLNSEKSKIDLLIRNENKERKDQEGKIVFLRKAKNKISEDNSGVRENIYRDFC